MKKTTVYGFGLAALLLGLPAAGSAQLHVSIGIAFPEPPPLVVVSPGIQIVPEFDEEVFFVSGWYWVRRDDAWYRTRDWHGGWAPCRRTWVPPGLARIPPGRYRHYYRDDDGRWRPHGPDEFRAWRDRNPPDQRRGWWREHRHDERVRWERRNAWQGRSWEERGSRPSAPPPREVRREERRDDRRDDRREDRRDDRRDDRREDRPHGRGHH